MRTKEGSGASFIWATLGLFGASGIAVTSEMNWVDTYQDVVA